MYYKSPAQRRAIFARYAQKADRGVRHLVTRADRGARRAGNEVRRRFNAASAGALAIGGTAAGIASLNQYVTHVPVSKVLPRYGPFMAAYTAIPAVAAYLASRRQKATKRRQLAVAGGAGLAGLGTWLGERSLLHSLPALAPKKYWIQDMRPTSKLKYARMAVLGLHGVPLALSSGAAIGLGERLLAGPGDRKERRKRVRRAIGVGLGSFLGGLALEEGTKVLPKKYSVPARYVATAAQHAVAPAYLAHYMWRHRKHRKDVK